MKGKSNIQIQTLKEPDLKKSRRRDALNMLIKNGDLACQSIIFWFVLLFVFTIGLFLFALLFYGVCMVMTFSAIISSGFVFFLLTMAGIFSVVGVFGIVACLTLFSIISAYYVFAYHSIRPHIY